MLALDAELHLKGPGGWRVVRASEFFRGLYTVDLADDEILAKVRFSPVHGSAYAKLYQRASRFAIVGAAAVLDVGDGTIRSAAVGLTGAESCAGRLPRVEEALAGQPATHDVIANAAALSGDGLEDLNDDIHASADYRRAMVSVFVRRALERALSRAAG